MSDAAALLAAILANPDDDLPRLMYADEIEPSEPARAEFIRVQVELASLAVRCPSGGDVERCRCEQFGPCKWCAAGEPLRRREREFLRDWTRTLLGEPKGLAPCRRGNELGYKTATGQFVAVEFRRGFVAEVSLPLAAFAGGPCPWCRGRGLEWYADATGDMGDRECEACGGMFGKIRGSGLTTGVAPALFARHPVERVTLTDREPIRIPG